MAATEKRINTFTQPPKVKACDCKNEQQDAIYGKGMRLWNNAPAKGAKPKRFRCTVCLKEQEF